MGCSQKYGCLLGIDYFVAPNILGSQIRQDPNFGNPAYRRIGDSGFKALGL